MQVRRALIPEPAKGKTMLILQLSKKR
jgi:hypothetical protein